jgi:hypothetical protein
MTALEIENVRKLPRREKLQIMETLWEDLSHPETDVESPVWHRQLLEETEARLGSGDEASMDWVEAKEKLRARFR